MTTLAEQIRAMPVARKLEWNNFDAWTYWAESISGTYRVEERNSVWQATLNLPGTKHIIYEYDMDGTTPNDFEAAVIAAQAHHEARLTVATTDLRGMLAEAVEALAFYGTEGAYDTQYTTRSCGCCTDIDDGPVIEDRGDQARATLARIAAQIGGAK